MRQRWRSHAISCRNEASTADVAARVAELRAQAAKVEAKAIEDAAKELSLMKERVLAELMKIGFNDISDACMWTDGALVPFDSGTLPKDVTAAISEVSIVGNKVKAKMQDKFSSLVKLGEHLGLFKQHVVMNGNVEVEVTDTASARAMFLDKLASIAVRLPAPPAQNENAPAEGPAGATSPLEERLALGAGQPMLHTKVLADDAI